VLLALTQAGVDREQAYRLVQRNAMRAWNGDGDLLSLLKADADVTCALSAAVVPATAQPAAPHPILTLPATGAFGVNGEFKGTISINRFEQRGNRIVAIGFVSGVLQRANQAIGTGVAGEIAWPVRLRSGAVVLASAPAPAAPTLTRAAWSLDPSPVARVAAFQDCPVLNLALGPINVNLLGVQVALSAVSLDLTGISGTPLGDLVCQVSALIGNVAGLVGVLNSLLGLVTGLLGGLTGGLGGLAPVAVVPGGSSQAVISAMAISATVPRLQ